MKLLKPYSVVFGVFLFIGGQIVNAATFEGLIDRIQTKSNGYFIVYVTANSNNECGSNMVMINEPNAVGTNRIFSALLSYQAQKRKVQFPINGCNGNVGVFSKIEDKS